ncbi:uncharacterized protein LOC127720176 isoform X3 [Mytilus californianus]|uniref:uncharacterized protein LOC127720176 isoform X3 n=1 Tax=Mytilus californianus TaxID=6549 RepID=UPI0022486B96|nr:uncharacterized protein LOC127720176 isoform X3 [Mytilus californianus]
MPKLKRNCWTLPYHRKRRAIKQLQHVKSLRKKTLASTKPEEFTVEEADSGVVIGTGTIHDSYWSVTIPEDGNHFDGDLNNGTTQDIFKNEHIDLELEIDVDEHLAKEQCIQINGEEENSFEKIDIEGNCNTEHDIRIDEEEENSFETSQYVGIGSEMVSSESNELSGVVSPITSYIDNSYNTVQTDGIRLTRNEENSFETVQYVEIGPEMVSSENNELNRVVSPFPSYNSYSTVFTDHVTDAKCHQDSNDVSESNELGGVISPITLYNNNSYNTAQTDTRSQKNYHNGSESNISNDLVTVKVELPDGTTELLESIPYDSYQTVQSDIDLYGSHTDNVNIQNNKIMSESELFRITHNVNTIPDQSMPGSSTQSFIPAHDHVEEGQENCQEWDIGMLPFVMETMKEQENTQSLLDKNIQKAKKKKVQEAKWKAGICSFNRCCPGCDTFGNNVRKPTKSKKTKTTKTASVLGEEKIQLCSKRKIPKERCDFCGMVFSGASQKYKKQNHIIAEHCSKEVREQLRKRKKKDEVVYKTKLKFKYAEIKLNLEFPDELYGMECIECNKVIREEHFRKILKCTKCNYSSLCSRAYIEHMINRHGTKNRASNKFVPCSSRFMECACGFVHIEGNKMAEHLHLCEYNQFSCKIVHSKQISSGREDDPDIDVITIEDYINETSQEIECTEIRDDAALQERSTPSKVLYNYKRHKCSKCFTILKKQIEEEQQRKAIQEVNEHHNYNKPSCLSLQTNSKEVYVWEPRFPFGIPTVVNESLTNLQNSQVIENQALQSVGQSSGSRENWTWTNSKRSQQRKDLKELIQQRQNLEKLIQQKTKKTLEPTETNKKPSRNNVHNGLERRRKPKPTDTNKKPSRSEVHNDLERGRRREMSDFFTGLMRSLPGYSAGKESIPKIKILKNAEKCIISLTKESFDLEHEKEWLQRQNFLLNENLKHCNEMITVLPLT